MQQYSIVEVEHTDGVILLSVGGELDVAEARGFQDEVERYAAQATSGVDIDLTELRFIDSSGINALLHARQAIVDGGGRFRIVAASPIAHRLFTLTGLDELL